MMQHVKVSPSATATTVPVKSWAISAVAANGWAIVCALSGSRVDALRPLQALPPRTSLSPHQWSGP